MARSSFCSLPVGAYFRFCGGKAYYKKVSGPKSVRGSRYRGAYAQLYRQPGNRWYFPARGCPCVIRSSAKHARARAVRRHLEVASGKGGR